MKRRTDGHRARLDAHVFVCTNDRDSEYACCADAGGDETLAAVKTWLRDRDAFWSTVSVTSTGCLGFCSEGGTALAIQPHNEWYSDVRPADVPTLLESVFGPNAERTRVASDEYAAEKSA